MRRLISTTGLLAGLLLLLPTTAAAQDGTGSVTVVHGIPDAVLSGSSNVDVYANGDYGTPLLGGDADFVFEDVVGPVELPAADYTLEVYPDGADPAATEPAIEAGPVTLPAGADVTIVAGLEEDGTPTLFVFANDTSAVAAGEARLTVRHTAAAPAVDVLAAGSVVFGGLAPGGEQASADVAAGDYADVAVNAAGTDTTALALGDVSLAEGTSTIVYAIGSLEGGSLTAAVQAIEGLHSAPAGVPGGSAGLATDGLPGWVLALVLTGVALVATPVLARSRARR